MSDHTSPVAIAEPLQPLAVPLNRLQALPGNPRRGDVDAVARSYTVFGQRKPIVARRTGGTDEEPTGIVVAGNHQLEAARQLGWDEIAVVWTADDEMTAKAFALADNRTADLGGYDDEALADMLGEVATDADLFAATAFTESDLEDLLAVSQPYDPEAEWVGMPEFDQPGRNEAAKVVIRFPTVENQEDFFRLLGIPVKGSLWWPHDDGHRTQDTTRRVVIADAGDDDE